MKRLYMAIITVLCSIGIAIAVSHAWFINGFDVDPLATGSSVDAYYHSGDGTEDNPYVITSARHLYNLAWLQYLGMYNRPDSQNQTDYPATYFKLGTTEGGTLDMTGWPLPPIGTAKYPFIGNFNGNGWTITGLTTTNNFTEFGNKHPSGVNQSNFERENCATIGFFGAIGPYNDSIISDSITTTGYTYDSTNNSAYHFYLDGSHVHTAVSTTIIGTVAGYVNAELSEIGVIQPHLNITNGDGGQASAKLGTNYSDFAVVGYAEEEYTTQKTKSSTIIYNPIYEYDHFNFKGMGAQTDWGGSMNMANLYSRIKAKIPAGTNKSTNYVNSEMRYENFAKTKLTTTTTDSTLVSSVSDTANGNYAKYNRTNTENYQYLKTVYKTVSIITKTDTVLNGFTIASSQTNPTYLSLSSSRIGTTFTFNVNLASSLNPRTWLIDSSNRIYTYSEDDSYKYYLVADSTLSLSVTSDANAASSWVWDNNSYRTTINGTNYYLKYFNDEWTLKNTYLISDGNGNYLKLDTSATNNLGTTTTAADATPFMFSNDGTNPYGNIYTTDGYYLRNNGTTLQLSTTNSNNTWNNNGGQLFRTINNLPYYIQYNNGWVLTTPTTYYIQYNGNYLYLNNSGQIQTAGTSNINNATEFTISNALVNGTGTGTISATVNNQTYYLRYNNYNTFNTSTSTGTYTTWSNDGHGFYQTNNNTKYYIQYRNNTWQMSSTISQMLSGFYISNNGNYLSHNNTTVTNTTSQSDATIWHFTNQTATNPSGGIYTIINETKYYLTCPTTSGNYVVELSLSTSPVTFTNSNGMLKDTSTNCYIIFYSLNGNYWWSYANSYNSQTLTAAYASDYDNTPLGYLTAKGINALTVSESHYIYRPTATINEYTREDNVTEPSVYNYIPLNAETTSPYAVETNNTGYIMSGAYENSTYHSDIRVSQYGLSNINSSYANSAWKNNGILTVGANGYGKSKSIGSSTYPESNFSKYKSSKEQLLETLKSNSSYVYGLHFMNATININHLVVAPKVLINGKEYTNYQMPEDCIDFQLASRGYINFFAGSYYPDNDSFFSLHQIFRDGNNKITAIKHISKIYAANSTWGTGYKSAEFVYLYDDDTYSDPTFTLTSKYSLAFDKTWIETPENLGGGDLSNSFGTYLWYFEIPVNKGEFALGSVSGGTGAYLIYLDIGANAAPVDRTIITQKTQTTKEALVYVNGIQILDADDKTYTYDYDSAVAIIPTSITGNVDITRSDDAITFSASSTLNSTYANDGITLTGAVWSPVSTSTSITKMLRYVDYNRATDKLYYTTIYNTGTTDSNGTNTSYDCYQINPSTGAIIEQITDTSDQADWGILINVNGSGSSTQFADHANIYNKNYGSTTILDYYAYIDTDKVSTLTEKYNMTVAEDSYVVPAATSDYTYEHSFHLSGDAITMAPDDLVVYIGPDKKAQAVITYSGNVATVTVGDYAFTFNASEIDFSTKTVVIYVA